MFSLELSRRLVNEHIRVSEKANATFTRVLSNLSLGRSLNNAIVEQLSLLKTLIDIDGIGCILAVNILSRVPHLALRKSNGSQQY